MLCWLKEGTLDPYNIAGAQSEKLKAYAWVGVSQPTPVLRAGQVMSSPVVTLDKSQSGAQALELMTQRQVHHLPITDEGRLVGLTSDRDLLANKDSLDLPVTHTMARKLLTGGVDSPLWLVAKIMTERHINCVPIIDSERSLEGILTSLDLLGCMTHCAPVEVWL